MEKAATLYAPIEEKNKEEIELRGPLPRSLFEEGLHLLEHTALVGRRCTKVGRTGPSERLRETYRSTKGSCCLVLQPAASSCALYWQILI